MYLKYVFVEGFKSFPEPSGLELDPGVCVFVGGNGTGKSNLTDAVAWVLGENDLSVLRCRTADDLVFAGSDELLPMASGAVIAVLDHRPARVKLEGLSMNACKHGHAAKHTRELPEGAVTIAREIDAAGVERFHVDGVETTAEAVKAALAGLGVAFPPVSVIRQGELERLLLLDARARRRVIEEAVGIPDLGRKHDELAVEIAAVRLQQEHLLGEREEVAQHAAALEAAALSGERARTIADSAAQLQDIGPVNTRAVADLETARTHLADIERRLDAAAETANTLEDGARELEAQMSGVFRDALARVEDRFRSYYELLAPGGEASLPLVDAEGSQGVDVMARPPPARSSTG
ncbi:MAG: AAA family ATPase [Thermoleophilia bacterium]